MYKTDLYEEMISKIEPIKKALDDCKKYAKFLKNGHKTEKGAELLAKKFEEFTAIRESIDDLYKTHEEWFKTATPLEGFTPVGDIGYGIRAIYNEEEMDPIAYKVVEMKVLDENGEYLTAKSKDCSAGHFQVNPHSENAQYLTATGFSSAPEIYFFWWKDDANKFAKMLRRQIKKAS